MADLSVFKTPDNSFYFNGTREQKQMHTSIHKHRKAWHNNVLITELLKTAVFHYLPRFKVWLYAYIFTRLH